MYHLSVSQSGRFVSVWQFDYWLATVTHCASMQYDSVGFYHVYIYRYGCHGWALIPDLVVDLVQLSSAGLGLHPLSSHTAVILSPGL